MQPFRVPGQLGEMESCSAEEEVFLVPIFALKNLPISFSLMHLCSKPTGVAGLKILVEAYTNIEA